MKTAIFAQWHEPDGIERFTSGVNGSALNSPADAAAPRNQIRPSIFTQPGSRAAIIDIVGVHSFPYRSLHFQTLLWSGENLSVRSR